MTHSLNNEIRELDAAADDDRANDPIAARKKAMDLLARREHAADELATKLKRAGFSEVTAAKAIAELAREGLQSDERFVESFVQSRVNQGKGPRRIQADLRQRGVSDSAIAHALEMADPDWYALARETRERKFGRASPAEYKDKARQMRFLQYRGFEADQIRAAFGDS